MANVAATEELARIRSSISTFRQREAELSQMVGESTSPDLATKHSFEDDAVSLFERMSSAELMELYQTDKERWQKVMDSVQSAGERKLARLSTRSTRR